MKTLHWATLIFASLIAIHTWADDDDAKKFPNRMETNPTTPPKTQVVGVPAQQSGGTGSLSPGAGSQMGAGIQIPLGGGSKNAAPDNDQDQDEDMSPKKK
jgi:hypothetical protein